MKFLSKLKYILLLTVSIYNTASSLPINPFINTISPSMNANSVNKSSDIVITFTQDMNPATISNTNIKVFGYQTGLLSTSVIYNAVLKTATINPTEIIHYLSY
ncbi:MAG: Ig-like domain-containing protein [Bacteroidota bacterium]|nr:Ig-like domain-containing protein [Bacteroidota bacterium]